MAGPHRRESRRCRRRGTWWQAVAIAAGTASARRSVSTSARRCSSDSLLCYSESAARLEESPYPPPRHLPPPPAAPVSNGSVALSGMTFVACSRCVHGKLKKEVWLSTEKKRVLALIFNKKILRLFATRQHPPFLKCLFHYTQKLNGTFRFSGAGLFLCVNCSFSGGCFWDLHSKTQKQTLCGSDSRFIFASITLNHELKVGRFWHKKLFSFNCRHKSSCVLEQKRTFCGQKFFGL